MVKKLFPSKSVKSFRFNKNLAKVLIMSIKVSKKSNCCRIDVTLCILKI